MRYIPNKHKPTVRHEQVRTERKAARTKVIPRTPATTLSIFLTRAKKKKNGRTVVNLWGRRRSE